MCIPSSRGPRDKVKSPQVNPKVILVQCGVVVVVLVGAFQLLEYHIVGEEGE